MPRPQRPDWDHVGTKPDNMALLCIFADLPVAQTHFLRSRRARQRGNLSTQRSREFIENNGVAIQSAPLSELTARHGGVRWRELKPARRIGAGGQAGIGLLRCAGGIGH